MIMSRKEKDDLFSLREFLYSLLVSEFKFKIVFESKE